MRYPEPVFPAMFTQDNVDLQKSLLELITALSAWNLNLKAMMDGGLSFADNFDCAFVSFTSNAAPDTEDTVAHDLGRVPAYFAVVSLNKGAVVYKGPTAFTKTNVYVKTSVASTDVILMLF